MDFQKTKNLPQKTLSNNVYQKKKQEKKQQQKLRQKPITSFSINHNSIVLKWNFTKLKIFLI